MNKRRKAASWGEEAWGANDVVALTRYALRNALVAAYTEGRGDGSDEATLDAEAEADRIMRDGLLIKEPTR